METIIINGSGRQVSSTSQKVSWGSPHTWPWQKIMLGLLVFVIGGLVVAGISHWQDRKKQARQQQVATIEKAITTKQKQAKDGALENLKPEDLQKEIQDLRSIAQEFPTALSGQEAASLLSELYGRWNQNEEIINMIQPAMLTKTLPGLLLSYRKIQALLDLSRYDEALALIDESLKKDQEKHMHAEFYYQKALAYLAKENREEARKAFQTVVDMKLTEGSTIKKKASQYLLWLESQ